MQHRQFAPAGSVRYQARRPPSRTVAGSSPPGRCAGCPDGSTRQRSPTSFVLRRVVVKVSPRALRGLSSKVVVERQVQMLSSGSNTVDRRSRPGPQRHLRIWRLLRLLVVDPLTRAGHPSPFRRPTRSSRRGSRHDRVDTTTSLPPRSPARITSLPSRSRSSRSRRTLITARPATLSCSRFSTGSCFHLRAAPKARRDRSGTPAAQVRRPRLVPAHGGGSIHVPVTGHLLVQYPDQISSTLPKYAASSADRSGPCFRRQNARPQRAAAEQHDASSSSTKS